MGQLRMLASILDRHSRLEKVEPEGFQWAPERLEANTNTALVHTHRLLMSYVIFNLLNADPENPKRNTLTTGQQ